MSYKPTGNPSGRPKANINKKTFEGLCSIQCTEEEICNVLDCDEVTLTRWCKSTYDGKGFSQVFREKRNEGKTSLRRKQWLLAEKNATMSIWLGKQYLGQSDKIETTNSIDTKIDVVVKGLSEEDIMRVKRLKEGLFNDN